MVSLKEIQICLNVGCICWIDKETDKLFYMPLFKDGTIDTNNGERVNFEIIKDKQYAEFRKIESDIRKRNSL